MHANETERKKINKWIKEVLIFHCREGKKKGGGRGGKVIVTALNIEKKKKKKSKDRARNYSDPAMIGASPHLFHFLIKPNTRPNEFANHVIAGDWRRRPGQTRDLFCKISIKRLNRLIHRIAQIEGGYLVERVEYE